jgi:LysM repeat protein
LYNSTSLTDDQFFAPQSESIVRKDKLVYHDLNGTRKTEMEEKLGKQLPNHSSPALALSSTTPDEKAPLADPAPSPTTEKPTGKRPADDVLHFVDPAVDTVTSLAIRYGVPAAALRSANALFSDQLLAARAKILIPGEHYAGPSLSPRPPGGEAAEVRRGKIRRVMVRCKLAE